MSIKKLYFYDSLIQDKQNNTNKTKDMKSIFYSIFANNSVNNEGVSTLVFPVGKEKVTLDVLKNSSAFLFCRVGKPKDAQGIMIRNQDTLHSSFVLQGEDVITKRLESCTYFLIEYETGIITFLFGNDAPRASCIPYMMEAFDENNVMMIFNVIQPESVVALTQKESTLSKIKYPFRVQDVTVLKAVGLSDTQILALSDADVYEAEIEIRSKPKKKLTSNLSVISGIINSIKGTSLERSVRFIGSESNNRQQEYDFLDSQLGFSVDLKDTKTEDGKKIKLSALEFEDQIHIKLRNSYINNKKKLLYLTNKIVD